MATIDYDTRNFKIGFNGELDVLACTLSKVGYQVIPFSQNVPIDLLVTAEPVDPFPTIPVLYVGQQPQLSLSKYENIEYVDMGLEFPNIVHARARSFLEKKPPERYGHFYVIVGYTESGNSAVMDCLREFPHLIEIEKMSDRYKNIPQGSNEKKKYVTRQSLDEIIDREHLPYYEWEGCKVAYRLPPLTGEVRYDAAIDIHPTPEALSILRNIDGVVKIYFSTLTNLDTVGIVNVEQQYVHVEEDTHRGIGPQVRKSLTNMLPSAQFDFILDNTLFCKGYEREMFDMSRRVKAIIVETRRYPVGGDNAQQYSARYLDRLTGRLFGLSARNITDWTREGHKVVLKFSTQTIHDYLESCGYDIKGLDLPLEVAGIHVSGGRLNVFLYVPPPRDVQEPARNLYAHFLSLIQRSLGPYYHSKNLVHFGLSSKSLQAGVRQRRRDEGFIDGIVYSLGDSFQNQGSRPYALSIIFTNYLAPRKPFPKMSSGENISRSLAELDTARWRFRESLLRSIGPDL